MLVRLLLWIGLVVPVLPTGLRADVGQIGLLRNALRQSNTACDSLEKQRSYIVAQAESLSTYIDSLKATDEELEELHEALRASLGLVQHLVGLDHSLEAARSYQDSLLDQLRLEYDWEIGVLIQQLQSQPDGGLLTQLMVYQEARESLGMRTSRGVLRYDDDMSIGREDGPEEIRQKLELMEDLAQRLDRDEHSIAQRLDELEEAYRLRMAMRTFVRGTSHSSTQENRAATVTLAEGDGRRGALVDDGLLSALVVDASRVAALDGVSSDDLLLEIQKWKVRQQEIRQLKSVVQERSEAFRGYLSEMLKGPTVRP